jgi:hypothetical protein
MVEAVYRKLDIAREYLDAAIEFFLARHNFFCAIHLAAAAEELFGAHLPGRATRRSLAKPTRTEKRRERYSRIVWYR